MIVLDSNVIVHCIDEGIRVPEGELVVPDDLHDEYEVMKIRYGSHKVPAVTNISEYSDYDDVYYLQRYAHYLNEYGEVYLARMSGLADVSILALVDCLVHDYGRDGQQTSFDLGSEFTNMVTVITDDVTLASRLTAEFNDSITLLHSSDL